MAEVSQHSIPYWAKLRRSPLTLCLRSRGTHFPFLFFTLLTVTLPPSPARCMWKKPPELLITNSSYWLALIWVSVRIFCFFVFVKGRYKKMPRWTGRTRGGHTGVRRQQRVTFTRLYNLEKVFFYFLYIYVSWLQVSGSAVPCGGKWNRDLLVTWESLSVTERTISVCDNHTERRGFITSMTGGPSPGPTSAWLHDDLSRLFHSDFQ